MTPPVAFVFKRVEVMFEIARLVVVACCSEVLPRAVNAWVESAPADVMDVVPVPPIANVFPEMADVEAFTKVTFEVVRTF